MREMTLDEWHAKRRRAIRALLPVARAKGGAKGVKRGRPRSAEEREAIIRGTRALVRRRAEEGRLVRVGPKEYVLRVVPRHRS